MNSQIYYLAVLAYIDSNLDELQEEFGDLPEKVQKVEKRLKAANTLVEDTNRILEEVRKFASDSKVTLVDLKTKEEKLAKQQFLVRNNKEFDAITKEIENIRFEYNKLVDELRGCGVKEENLIKTVEQQKKDALEVEKELEEANAELELITNDQNDEVKEFIKKRKEIVKNLKSEVLAEYERIRAHTRDTAVRIRRNSCSGCFSAVPAQKIVEIRNNLDHLYLCENCGRILYPEEFEINETTISEL